MKAWIANGEFGSDASNNMMVYDNHVVTAGGSTNYGLRELGGPTTGCFYHDNDFSAAATPMLLDSGSIVRAHDNKGATAIQETKVIRMKNTSGGALAAGDIVISKAVAAGDEVTTTTTQGDDKVFGMATAAISNNAYGDFLTIGKTVSLKVDGTTDIAVGDLLGTFTTAKIAMKASAGDMAFAIALEAYTSNDSNGVIDAILITPRLI